MKVFGYIILVFSLISSSAFSQILNSGFEHWDGIDPAHWWTNNTTDYITVTPTTDAHSGSLAVKGEVIVPEPEFPQVTYAPKLFSGSMTEGFPYTDRPDTIRGYYKFFPVGGDQFDINIYLMQGETPVGFWEETISAPTDSSYQEAAYKIIYFDSTTVPDRIHIEFFILPGDGQTASEGTTFFVDDFPGLNLIRPPEVAGDERIIFIAGEKEKIKWNPGGVSYVDIEYSEDNGNSYSPIVSHYAADSGKYKWDVPEDLLTRKAKIRIKDSFSPDVSTKSTQFSIKPWQFTRLVGNDEFELFKPYEDGWSFGNKGVNMWPLTWWEQFDYWGIDPYTAENYPPEEPFSSAQPLEFPDWPLFVDVFSVGQCYSQYGFWYTSEALTKWAAIKRPWPGSCYGFAVSSLLGFYHGSALNQFFNYYGNLATVPLTDSTRYAVNYYFIHQFGAEARSHRIQNRNTTPRQLLAQLKAMFKKENGDGRGLGFENVGGSGAHAVTPYQLKRDGDTHRFKLRVYDSRSPGSTDKYIQIDSSANTWSDHTGLGWGPASRGCMLLRESAELLATPSLKSSPISAVTKIPENPLGMTIYNSTEANINIHSFTGGQIGYVDSVAFNTLTDGMPIIPAVGGFHPPIGYDLPAAGYSIEMTDFSDSLSYAYFLTDSAIYNYRRTQALENETDLLDYVNDGLSLINPDQVVKTTNLETIFLQDSTAEKKFVIQNLGMSSQDSLYLTGQHQNELLLQNYGTNTQYDLRVQYVSESGRSTFSHAAVLLAANSTHQIVPVWDTLGDTTLTIYVDNGNDGTPDDSVQLTNETTDIENGRGNLLIPEKYHLDQNYPNPFNPTTTIGYSLPQDSKVQLIIYDIAGREIWRYSQSMQTAGWHTIQWNGQNKLGQKVSTGVYFYRLQADQFVDVKKMMFMK